MTLSSEPMARLDGTRSVVPVPLRPLVLWLMLRVWRDEQDQHLLKLTQRQCRLQPRDIPELVPRKLDPAEKAAMSLKMLVTRQVQHQSYLLRLQFAEAAFDRAKLYQIKRPYDFLAAYCGLVDRRITEGSLPVEVASILGGIMVENRMIEQGDYYSSAMSIAQEICEAIVDNFGDGEYPPEPEEE